MYFGLQQFGGSAAIGGLRLDVCWKDPEILSAGLHLNERKRDSVHGSVRESLKMEKATFCSIQSLARTL